MFSTSLIVDVSGQDRPDVILKLSKTQVAVLYDLINKSHKAGADPSSRWTAVRNELSMAFAETSDIIAGRTKPLQNH